MARNGERRKTNVEESKEDLSPSLPNPAPSPFFLTHFSLLFPNYLKACYRLNTCIPSFSTFYGIYSTWASSTFGALLLISRNGLVVLTFQLELLLAGVTVFFLSFFYFFFVSFYRIFLDVFFAFSPVSLTLPLPLLCSRQEGTTNHSFDYSALLAYAKSTGCFVVWKTLHWLTF